MVKDYILRLCLDSPLYFKLTEFQLEKKLSKTYAGLLVFVEGMRSLGLIDENTYDYYVSRYSKPLSALPFELNVQKCWICKTATATRKAISKETNKTYYFCDKCVKQVLNHPKWDVHEG